MQVSSSKNGICPGVVTSRCLMRSSYLASYVFSDGEGSVKGFVVADNGDGGDLVWRPLIESSTASGWWNAGPRKDFTQGYADFDDAWAVLLKEAAEILGGN